MPNPIKSLNYYSFKDQETKEHLIKLSISKIFHNYFTDLNINAFTSREQVYWFRDAAATMTLYFKYGDIRAAILRLMKITDAYDIIVKSQYHVPWMIKHEKLIQALYHTVKICPIPMKIWSDVIEQQEQFQWLSLTYD